MRSNRRSLCKSFEYFGVCGDVTTLQVESLTSARKSAMSGNEPSDAIRVVNALLTQLDAIKSYPNVVILTTSNITGAIDLAFVDRADIKQYIGPPSPKAIYRIYQSCIDELMRVSGSVHLTLMSSVKQVKHVTFTSGGNHLSESKDLRLGVVETHGKNERCYS